MSLNRRDLMSAGMLAALGSAALAQTSPPAASGAAPGGAAGGRGPAPPLAPPSLIIPLWPGTPPGGEGRAARSPGAAPAPIARNIDMPVLALYRPANPDGSSVIVCPGGGYFMLSQGSEGVSPALRFNSDRITAFVLTYRLPGEGWNGAKDVPLQDAQRAIRIVRSRAAEFGVDPKRVGILGFSAGGHVASTLATSHAEQVYAPVDAADSQQTRPAFAGLVYPVITMKPGLTYGPGLPLLLGQNPSADLIASRSNELRVTADTAPCFIAQAFNDPLVPVDNSILMMQALRAQKITCETHLFQEGGHGFGLGPASQPNGLWADLFIRWARRIAPAAA